MNADPSAIVQKVWNDTHVPKNTGVGYGDDAERITYLLFLKLADEDWFGMDVDIKGAIYEGLLERTTGVCVHRVVMVKKYLT